MKPVTGLPIEDQPPWVLARMCLWAEARGEGVLGMWCVLSVLLNRARRRTLITHVSFDKALGEVVLDPFQFSSFNRTDPNRAKLLTAYKTDPTGWGRADAVCYMHEDAVERGLQIPDPTMGARHYYNPAVASPDWGRGHPGWKETVVVGKHVFGNAA